MQGVPEIHFGKLAPMVFMQYYIGIHKQNNSLFLIMVLSLINLEPIALLVLLTMSSFGAWMK